MGLYALPQRWDLLRACLGSRPQQGLGVLLCDCRDMRALMKKLKAEQSVLDKKEAQMYSKAFQRMAQAPDNKPQKAAQVRNH